MFLPALCICTMCLSGDYEGQGRSIESPQIVESHVVVSWDMCAEN